jgi:hypothetical protein
MRTLLRGVIAAAVLLGSGQGIRAEQTVMFPDPQGKMVRIPIAHNYEQCRKNGRHLGYPDADSQAWCSEHCKGNICQADDHVMVPDPQGKMVRIPIAHNYEQCRKNGRHLGYPDADSHAWCSEHCKGNICQ